MDSSEDQNPSIISCDHESMYDNVSVNENDPKEFQSSESDFEPFEAEVNEEEEEKPDAFDYIIAAFTVKRRKILIDQDNDEDHIISYIDSESRILIMLFILASCLIHVCNYLVISQLHESFSNEHKIQSSIQLAPISLKPLRPHVALLFKNGHLEVFEQEGLTLNHSWDFKFPAVQFGTGYLVYTQPGIINTIFSDGNKNSIFLTPGGQHGPIQNSKIPRNYFYNPRFLQVGYHFLIFGGKWKIVNEYENGMTDDVSKYDHFDFLCLEYFEVTRKSLVWNSRKKVYYSGPELPDLSMLRGCPLALNRTHVLILTSNTTGLDYCVDAWTYSFDQNQWDFKHCILNLTLPYPSYLYEFELQCSSYYDKVNLFSVFLLIKGVECNDVPFEGNILRVAIFNVNGIFWINHNIFEVNNDLQIDDAYEVFAIQGRIYIITTPAGLSMDPIGLISNLKLYQLVNLSIQFVQDLPVKPFEPNPHLTFIGTGPKDFIVIPALL